jgi:hypothetical protein
LKQHGKNVDKEFTNSRPLDQFGASNNFIDDDGSEDLAPRSRAHIDEDNEEIQRKKKEADDRKRLLT